MRMPRDEQSFRIDMIISMLRPSREISVHTSRSSGFIRRISLPDCWESGVDWTFTVVDGEIVWPATFDTGYLIDAAVGNVWIKSGDSFVEDGTLYLIVDSYYLPDYYNYDLDSAYEFFTLPEGVTL